MTDPEGLDIPTTFSSLLSLPPPQQPFNDNTSTLCRSCRVNMVSEFLERKNTEAGEPPQWQERDFIFMEHLYECTTCPACVFILKIVLMTPGAREASEDGKKGGVILSKEVGFSFFYFLGAHFGESIVNELCFAYGMANISAIRDF